MMDIVLLGFFAQLVCMYGLILFSDYRKYVEARALRTLPVAPQIAATTLTLVGSKAHIENVRRRA